MSHSFRSLGVAALMAVAASGPACADLLDDAVSMEANVAGIQPVDAWIAATAVREARAFALASTATTAEGPLSAALTGTSLWTFVTSVRAQQQSDRFVILQANVSLLQLAEAVPAPIPLPGALWFMVMGLLGLAGVRITGTGAQARIRKSAIGGLPALQA